MDSDHCKLFIGGLSWDTDETKLREYFSLYGDVLQTVVMRDKATGRPRGFGFVVFSNPDVIDKVIAEQHVIEGRTVEAKRALSRDEQQTSTRSANGGNARNFGSGGNVRTKKIFVGGLPATITEDGFRQYFEAYGTVTDVVVMFDQQTQRPRGFGFISFDNEDAVDKVLHKTFHDLNGKQVEVKRALPKDGISGGGGGGGRSMGGAGTGGGSGGYQGYGASGGGSGSYDSRMDTNRYMQSQNTGTGFQGYGSSGYGAAGYGYGPGNTGGFGAYGGYGAPTGAAYGNPNVPAGGYGGGPQGGARNSGYGAVGYGNAAAPWGGPGGAAGGVGGGNLVSSATGQSPGGGAYGYGGMDGSYANQAPYGAVGGRTGNVPNTNVSAGGVDVQGGGGGGYMGGGGYGDTNGNLAYGNQGWRSDPSQAPANYGGAVGYGGGYGAPARQ